MNTTIDKIKMGMATYIDKEVLSSFPETSPKRILGGAAAAVFISNKAGALVELANGLGLVNEDGTINLDPFKEEIVKRMGPSGIVQYVPGIGNLTFDKEDIESIYNHIVS